MRLWSLHPKYLDTKGLVALWRETLLAQNVLLNKTKGYKNHPQLTRFRREEDPISSIGSYLRGIKKESDSRGFQFNGAKIVPSRPADPVPVTIGQMEFEWDHLLGKLKNRSTSLYNKIKDLSDLEPHHMFVVISGSVEDWEKIKK